MIKCLCFLCVATLSLHATEISNEEVLVVDTNLVYVTSSFDEVDYFSTYSHSGSIAWEVPFGSKIVSWKKLDDDQLVIFSKNRNGLAFYLTCVDSATGQLVWEKPIYAPKPTTTPQTEE